MSAMLVEPRQNKLLSALSEDVMDCLYPHLEIVSLSLGEVLYESGHDRRHVYFPVDSIVSRQQDLENGSSTETAMIGNEGIFGINFLMGADGSPWHAVVHSAGFAYRLQVQHLNEELDHHAELRKLVMRYTLSRITQISQTAVCNRYHSVDQQVCRWLLQTLDRLPGSTITMTQEILSHALGVRREGVTGAACKLHKQGVIEYSRGIITVLDREKLESLSCECYAAIRKETDRLLPAESVDWTRTSPCRKFALPEPCGISQSRQ